jgi:hypothetical protein
VGFGVDYVEKWVRVYPGGRLARLEQVRGIAASVGQYGSFGVSFSAWGSQMRTSQFVWLVVLAGAAVAAAAAIVVLSAVNDKAQREIQAQQLAINNGVLGPQGQQISAAILQDMASVSANNREMSNLLRRYGYTVQSGAPSNAPAANGAFGAAAKGSSEVTDEQ